MSSLLRLWQTEGLDADRRYCVVTFDDGWIDTYRVAFPVLRRHHIPAVVFLPTAFIGTCEWFWSEKLGWLVEALMREKQDRRHTIVASLEHMFPWLRQVSNNMLRGDVDPVIEWSKAQDQQVIDSCLSHWAEVMNLELPSDRVFMNWEEAREMRAAGIEFGSHAVSHRIMTTMTREVILKELKDSLAALDEQGLSPTSVFCYPNGNWSPEVADCVELAGYQAATTTEFGFEMRTPPRMFGLKRVNIHHDMTSTSDLFAFHLAGFNNLKES